MKKKFLLAIAMVAVLVCLFAISISAAEVGGVNYTVSGTSATVTGLADKTMENIVIPSTIEVDGATYTVTTINSEAFAGASAVTIALPETITKLNNSKTFNNCQNLTTITGFGRLIENRVVTSIGQYMFNNCKNLVNIDGLMTNGVLIFPETITSINSACAFTECDKIVYVEFPSTITSVGQAAFSFCDSLQLVSFDKVDAKIKAAIAKGEKYTPVSFVNCGTFKGCKSLVAMSVPEGTTSIINRFVAQGCTSLTAFYMPNSVSHLGTNGSTQGPFCSANKMYFVEESFTVGQCLVDGKVDLSKLVLPEKPTVYHLPTSLKDFSNHIESNPHGKAGTLFYGCVSLNEVIVFPEGFTGVNKSGAGVFGYNFFNGLGTKDSPKTVVFLGDMQYYVTSQSAQYVSFVFANPNDKTPDDIGIVRVYNKNNHADSYLYFCAEGTRYDYNITSTASTDDTLEDLIKAIVATKTNVAKHVANGTEKSFDADCLKNARVSKLCFCGAEVSSVEEEGTALGHAFNNDLGMNYADYFANGTHAFGCIRCEETEEIILAPLFIWKGYSVNEAGKGINMSYAINAEALEAYEAYTKKAVAYGFLVATGENLANNQYVMEHIFTEKYAVVEVVLNYGDVQNVDDVDVVMACVVSFDEKVSYSQEETDKATTDYAYGDVTLYGASYNDLK